MCVRVLRCIADERGLKSKSSMRVGQEPGRYRVGETRPGKRYGNNRLVQAVPRTTDNRVFPHAETTPSAIPLLIRFIFIRIDISIQETTALRLRKNFSFLFSFFFFYYNINIIIYLCIR